MLMHLMDIQKIDIQKSSACVFSIIYLNGIKLFFLQNKQKKVQINQ